VLTNNSELEVKVVNTSEMQRVLYLRDQLRPVKSVSFDHSGALLAVSCTDGVVYIYSLSSEEPQLIKRVDGLISLLDSESEASAKVAWHPDGRAFGAPNALNGMWQTQVEMSRLANVPQISRRLPEVTGSRRRGSVATVQRSPHQHGHITVPFWRLRQRTRASYYGRPGPRRS
jgi:WD40 repeat protein